MSKGGEIVRLYLTGIPVRKIAKKFGLSREGVYRYLRKEPLFDIYKRTHFCVKHKDWVNAVIEAQDRKDLLKRLGIKSNGYLSVLLRRLVKNGCIDKKVFLRFTKGERNLSEEIRKLIGAGMRNKDIAKKLGVSARFVATVRYNMFKSKRLDK